MQYIYEVLADRSVLHTQNNKKKLLSELKAITNDEEAGMMVKIRTDRFLLEYGKANDDGKFALLNEFLNWHHGGIVQQGMKGQIIDYTEMKLGDYCERGHIASVCPRCKRLGHVQDNEPDCFHVTTHIEKIGGALVSQVLDGCHLFSGMKWENPRKLINA